MIACAADLSANLAGFLRRLALPARGWPQDSRSTAAGFCARGMLPGMSEMVRRVWWHMTDEGYVIEVRFGIRVARNEHGEGSHEDAERIARQLARRFDAAEVPEEK